MHGLSVFKLDRDRVPTVNLDVGFLGERDGDLAFTDHRVIVVHTSVVAQIRSKVDVAASTATDLSITWHVAPPVI
jgi:hypothetical protein